MYNEHFVGIIGKMSDLQISEHAVEREFQVREFASKKNVNNIA